MKDRHFMTVLALVVAAGLVMGLIAFRMSGAKDAAAVPAPTTNAVAGGPGVHPSAADQEIDQPAQPPEQPQIADVDSGEPKAPKVDAPEMLPPSSGDAPGTAAVEPAQPGAPQAAPGDAVQ